MHPIRRCCRLLCLLKKFVERLFRCNHVEHDLVQDARKMGVRIGAGTVFTDGMPQFGSEPFFVEIGENSAIAGRVVFLTHDGGVLSVRNLLSDVGTILKFGKIRVGDRVFIGLRTTILPGVTIGDGSIIGACSVVTKNVPPGEIWAGNPARRISTVDEYAKKVRVLSTSSEQLALSREVLAQRGYVWER